MAVENDAGIGQFVHPSMGSKLAGCSYPRRRAVIHGNRIDAAGEFIQARCRLGNIDDVAAAGGDVAEEGVNQSALDGVGSDRGNLVQDRFTLIEQAGAEAQPVGGQGAQPAVPEPGKCFPLPREQETVAQDVLQVRYKGGMEDGGVIDVRLLQRHGAAGDDTEPLHDDPLAGAEEPGNLGGGVGFQLAAA